MPLNKKKVRMKIHFESIFFEYVFGFFFNSKITFQNGILNFLISRMYFFQFYILVFRMKDTFKNLKMCRVQVKRLGVGRICRFLNTTHWAHNESTHCQPSILIYHFGFKLNNNKAVYSICKIVLLH